MKRRVPASPGGTQQSALKKSRLSALAQQHQNTRADQQARKTDASPPAGAAPIGRRGSPASAGADRQADAELGHPPYNSLDTAVLGNPVSKLWRASLEGSQGSAALHGLLSPQPVNDQLAPARLSSKQGSRTNLLHVSSSARSLKDLASRTGTGPQTSSALDRLTDALLATNPAFAGRPVEARHAAGLRVRDRNVLLETPPAPPKTAAEVAAAQRSRSAAQLRSMRGEGRSVLLPRGAAKYSQVAPILTTAWNTYITNLLAAPAATTTQPAAAATVAAQSANAAVAQRLLAADLHGCCVRVRSCGNPLHTGREGVVVQVTNTAIVLLDTQDRIHVVPKAKTCVSLTLPDGREVTMQLDARTDPLSKAVNAPRQLRRRRRRKDGLEHPVSAE